MKPSDVFDRRRFPRTETIPGTAIVVARDDQHARFSIDDLSAGGAQLVGEMDLQSGERVRVHLQINIDHVLSFDAEVVRTEIVPGDRYRVGVAFRSVPADIEDRVQRLVLSALERQRAEAVPALLILDDDPEIRAILERDLKQLGRRVVSVAAPLDAVRRLHDRSTRFDAALIDLQIGPASGIDMLAYLSDDHPTIRRVLMSGQIGSGVLDEVIASGRAHAVLAKPWTRGSLVTALDHR